MQFSSRTRWNVERTRYADALDAVRIEGAPCFDMTASNPTTCGFHYDSIGILRELSRPECLQYSPDPQGLPSARSAVTLYYQEVAGAQLSPERIFLTTSTSEAYSYLFRLHCNPGEEVLIAEPSYPLFDFLADLDEVRVVPYPLFHDYGWHIDLAALESRITRQTRAVVLVHPNNPTGNYTSVQEREALEQICLRHGLALIVDEVFLEYPQEPLSSAICSFASGEHPVLTYILSGLSKAAGLPQMKVAWLTIFGPEPIRLEATARLEIIADTFLSLNAPLQHAFPFLLTQRHGVQQQILARVRNNLAALDDLLAHAPLLSRLELQGGWYAVLRVPALTGGEELAVRLMQEQRVVVHPGYFYGFHGSGWVVISLLPPAEEFLEGAQRIVRFFS
ncbi:MAG TPA: pyridoxal phosphate-dependent aminotransferase [Acidobacteriaceae bacterium]|nr:pyridoxal phosphate-dependent aminotransferase [Acidobacteriaceae bacterium]